MLFHRHIQAFGRFFERLAYNNARRSLFLQFYSPNNFQSWRNRFNFISVKAVDKHEVNLEQILEGCRQNKRASQHQLFGLFFNYSMSIARRYTGNIESAEEVVNDAFFKVFTKIQLYNGAQPFRFWLRRVIINTAIDRLRSGLNQFKVTEWQPVHDSLSEPGIVEDMTREQILAMIDLLPPSYRTVFNLFTVDGFSHEEIADVLNISVGASKSNLSRARQHLKTIFADDFEFSRKI